MIAREIQREVEEAHGGSDRFPMTAQTEAIGLAELAEELAVLG